MRRARRSVPQRLYRDGRPGERRAARPARPGVPVAVSTSPIIALSSDGRTVALTVLQQPGEKALFAPRSSTLGSRRGPALLGSTLRRGPGPRSTERAARGHLPGLYYMPSFVRDVARATQAPFSSGLGYCSSAAIAGPRFVAFRRATPSSSPATPTASQTSSSSIAILTRTACRRNGRRPSASIRQSADANSDPDGDGARRSSPLAPSPRHVYPLSGGGATTSFFTTTIAVFNPATVAAHVVVRLLGEGGGSTRCRW